MPFIYILSIILDYIKRGLIRKEDNDWEIGDEVCDDDFKAFYLDSFKYVTINKESYLMKEEMAGIAN